jgi:Transposase IS200 like
VPRFSRCSRSGAFPSLDTSLSRLFITTDGCLRSQRETCYCPTLLRMPWGLHRYYGAGDLHFITCSCYRRQLLLGTARRRDLFLTVLEQVRRRYQFVVVGYVVMPEHFHLLISEPQERTRCRLRSDPLLEKREKRGTPFFFSADL